MSLKKYRKFGPLAGRIERAILEGNIPHASIIEGDSCLDKGAFARDIIKAIVCKEEPGTGCDSCVSCRKVDHGNYEDLYYARADELSLKDAAIEELQERLRNRPLGGDRNFAVIEDADSMTPRAQNRLLKTLEEPPEGTVIFLLSENTENLLPTVTSRCIVYRLTNFADTDTESGISFAEDVFEAALGGACFADIKERIALGVKDRKGAFAFLDGMERLFRGYMMGEISSRLTAGQLIRGVNLIEEARRDLYRNVNYRYAVRNLILKLEEG